MPPPPPSRQPPSPRGSTTKTATATTAEETDCSLFLSLLSLGTVKPPIGDFRGAEGTSTRKEKRTPARKGKEEAGGGKKSKSRGNEGKERGGERGKGRKGESVLRNDQSRTERMQNCPTINTFSFVIGPGPN
jgi:hypothetical protein